MPCFFLAHPPVANFNIIQILKNLIVLPVIEPTEYTDYAVLVMYQMTVCAPTYHPYSSGVKFPLPQGMYPTLIIILVALKKSHLENQFTSYGGVNTRNHDISFKPSQDAAWTHAFGSSSTESDIIVSSPVARTSAQDSKTEVGSKNEEKPDHDVVDANPLLVERRQGNLAV